MRECGVDREITFHTELHDLFRLKDAFVLPDFQCGHEALPLCYEVPEVIITLYRLPYLTTSRHQLLGVLTLCHLTHQALRLLDDVVHAVFGFNALEHLESRVGVKVRVRVRVRVRVPAPGVPRSCYLQLCN